MSGHPVAGAALLISAVLVLAGNAIAGGGLGKRLDVHVATGDSPYAVVDGNLGKPRRLAIRVDEQATDPVEGSYDLLCVKRHRGRRDLGDLQIEGRRVIRLRPTLSGADRCLLSVSVYSTGRGRIKLEVFGKRR